MDRELNVRSARLDADLANDRERGVAHHLHFKFFPADERFLDQYLAHRRHGETAAGDLIQLVRVVPDTAATAAESEGRPDDERESSDLFCNAAYVGKRARHARARHVEPNSQHGFLEQLSIFAFRDRLRVGADQSYFVTRECAVAIKLHRRIQRRLPAHRWQKRVRFFSNNDGFDHFRRDRLDVSAIGELRIGHDRGRIRIYQHDLIALFAQRLARLHAGIIKFAALPDHDWTGAN